MLLQNSMSRTYNTIRNMRFAILGQAVGIFIAFFSRRVFVDCLSSEYLGLNGLFSNILSILSLAELGVGGALVYSLYRPIAVNDIVEIKSLMLLYQKTYFVIGVTVFVSGCALIPFIQFFISAAPNVPHIRIIYLLYVINSAASYFFTYKRSLIIANQQGYITSIYRYGLFILMNIVQIIALVLTRNFLFYLLLQVAFTLFENILLSRKADRMYPYLLEKDISPLQPAVRAEIKKNVFAMMFHKIGGVIVMGTDSILISKLVGLTEVGIYSNYLLIRQAANTILGHMFQSAAASLGNLNVLESNERKLSVFQNINFAGAWIFGFSSICLITLYNPFISFWLGEGYLFSKPTVFWIVAVFYVTGMRQACLTARDVMGVFWHDRYKPLFESFINLLASYILGVRMGVEGILIGTVISTITTCFWVEPFILYKYALNAPVRTYFVRYGMYTLVTIAAGVINVFSCGLVITSGFTGFCVKLSICLIVPNVIFIACYHRTREFTFFLGLFLGSLGQIKNKFKVKSGWIFKFFR